MKVTIYVPDEKHGVYEEAKKELGDTISATFVRCLERELEAQRQATSRIVVDIKDPSTGRISKKAFDGRWIIGTGEDPEPFSFEPDSGIHTSGEHGGYAVAVTKAGRIFVLEFDSDRDAVQYHVEGDFEKFEAASTDDAHHYPIYPQSLKQAVAAELEIETIEDLNI